MAKSDTPLHKIDITKAVQKQNMAKFMNEKQINAFDTETSNGSVFMVSYAFPNMSGVIDSGNHEEMDTKELWDLLTFSQCRSNLNVWYNLDFDTNAILSGVLSEKEMSELVIKNRVKAIICGKEYDITYVKSKFLSIKEVENRNRFDHYDIAQFFYTSLDNASEEWLNETKLQDVDTTRFGSSVCDPHTREALDREKDPQPIEECSKCVTKQEAINYVRENYERIREYAEKDAKLTRRLARKLFTEGEKLDIPFGKPFSTGYLSAEYQRANTDHKPNFGNADIQSYFWESYHGGRFEVFERGNVGECVGPDINSAYPAIMADLPSPTSLEWEIVSNVSDNGFNFGFADIEECDYGVVKVKVTTDRDRKIQPFAYKMNGVTCYPAFEDIELIVLKDIFEFAVKEGIVTDYELIDGYLAMECEETVYPFKWLKDMYAQRKVYEDIDSKMKKGQLLKIVLNSAYGKTCQTTERKRLMELNEGEVYNLKENERLYPKDYLSEMQRKYIPDNMLIIETVESGKRFNPFFASYITGMTRLELHKRAIEYDLEEDAYMFATDCIMVDKDRYDKSGFEEIVQTPNTDLEGEIFKEEAKESLGLWDFDYSGIGFVVGSGVYEVVLPNGKIKTKTRGFTNSALDGKLVQSAEKNPNGIPLQNNRPITMAELFQQPNIGNVSDFTRQYKKLQPNFDSKRDWNVKDPSFTDLLNSSHGSKPLLVSKDFKYTQEEIVISQLKGATM